MEEKEMTVEQVKSAANEQIALLYQKLQEANMNNVFKRLDYLFRMMEGNFSTRVKALASVEIEKIVLGDTKEKTEEK